MKMKQILFLTGLLGQSLMYAGAAPVAPSAYVPFADLAEMQTAMNIYATAVLNNGPLSASYFAQKESLPVWSEENPTAWQNAESSFLNQKFNVGEVSSIDLVNYLKSNYGPSYNIDSSLASLNNTVNSFNSIKMPGDPNPTFVELPSGYTSPLDYLIIENISVSSVPKLIQNYISGTPLPSSKPNFDPIPSMPDGPTISSGTGSEVNSNIDVMDTYNEYLSEYKAQVKTVEGLQKLKSKLSGFDSYVESLKAQIKAAQKEGEDITDLDNSLADALAEQKAAMDAVNEAEPVDG